jgi:phosphoglycerate dehydrogenase-like enzyme
MKAVLQYRASSGFRKRLRELAPDWLDITVVNEADHAIFQEEMRDAEILLHVLEPVTAEVIARAPRLRLIQKIGVGVNTIDLESARSHGIAVANMPGTNSQAVAELTLLLMLAALRRIVHLDSVTRQGRGWNLKPEVFDGVGELCGRSVGLVGYGEVPRRLAPALKALGARVLYTATSPKADALAQWLTLDELLGESDVISLHLPLTPATANLLDDAAFARMKPGSVLINTSRGGLVDESALHSALRDGRLGAAGLDVFASEPVAPDHFLFGYDNVVLAPHVAWLTPETLERSLGIAIENCTRLREGRRLLNQVL